MSVEGAILPGPTPKIVHITFPQDTKSHDVVKFKIFDLGRVVIAALMATQSRFCDDKDLDGARNSDTEFINLTKCGLSGKVAV